MAGVRAVTIVVPLQFGLLTLTWIFGLLRMQNDQDRPILAWLPIAGPLVLHRFRDWRRWYLVAIAFTPTAIHPGAVRHSTAISVWRLALVTGHDYHDCPVYVRCWRIIFRGQPRQPGSLCAGNTAHFNQRAAVQVGDFSYGRRARRSPDRKRAAALQQLPAGHGFGLCCGKIRCKAHARSPGTPVCNGQASSSW